MTSKGVTFPRDRTRGTVFWKEINKLFIISTAICTHFPNGCGVPYESLERESKSLMFPSEVLKIATVLELTVNNLTKNPKTDYCN